MKAARIREKSLLASVIGLGALAVISGIVLLPHAFDNTEPETEQTIPTEVNTEATTDSPLAEAVADGAFNPYIMPMTFTRTKTILESSAMMEITTAPDGQFRMKEMITGDILSQGIWSYDDESQHLTLTHIGTYPMSNVFLVQKLGEEIPSDEEITSEDLHDIEIYRDVQLNNDTIINASQQEAQPAEEIQWQLVFLASESTNLKFGLLGDKDVFTQTSVSPAPEEIQVNSNNGEEGVI